MLAETIRQVDEIVAAVQATGRVPSLVAAIVRDGALAHFTGAGELPPPDADVQYRIGSISKTFTAALILQLRDEDRLSLDDLLYRHLPGTPVGGVTIRQLLAHVSGLQREPVGEWWERSAGPPVDEFLAELTPDKAVHPPLQTFHYSNLAYGLLGAVAERITGEALAARRARLRRAHRLDARLPGGARGAPGVAHRRGGLRQRIHAGRRYPHRRARDAPAGHGPGRGTGPGHAVAPGHRATGRHRAADRPLVVDGPGVRGRLGRRAAHVPDRRPQRGVALHPGRHRPVALPLGHEQRRGPGGPARPERRRRGAGHRDVRLHPGTVTKSISRSIAFRSGVSTSP